MDKEKRGDLSSIKIAPACQLLGQFKVFSFIKRSYRTACKIPLLWIEQWQLYALEEFIWNKKMSFSERFIIKRRPTSQSSLTKNSSKNWPMKRASQSTNFYLWGSLYNLKTEVGQVKTLFRKLFSALFKKQFYATEYEVLRSQVQA